VTTIAEAEQVLGAATARSALANGSTLLQWMSNDGNILTGPRAAHVSVLFDGSGRMVRVTHRFVTGS